MENLHRKLYRICKKKMDEKFVQIYVKFCRRLRNTKQWNWKMYKIG